jgi:hypothetical protein
MWMRFCPCERLLFGLKKSINDNCVALSHIPPGQARGFAIDDIRSAVDGHTYGIRKDNFECSPANIWDTKSNASPAAVINPFMPFSDCLPI